MEEGYPITSMYPDICDVYWILRVGKYAKILAEVYPNTSLYLGIYVNWGMKPSAELYYIKMAEGFT